MKTRILATCFTCLACFAVSLSAFAQGVITWNNSSTTLVSVNGGPMPARTDSTTTYYFGLFIAPAGTLATNSGWRDIDSDPNWQFVAYATNSAIAGRLQSPGPATVPGYAPGTNVSFVIHVWRCFSGVVVDWPANKWNMSEYLGRSPIGTMVLGTNGNLSPPAFGTGAGRLNGFNVDGPCLGCAVVWFDRHPANAVVSVGSAVTLTADAYYMQFVGPPVWWALAGAGHQWRKQGFPIPGATGRSLILTNVSLTNAGNYDVVGYNSYGNSPSASATLTVFIPASPATLGSPAYNANNQFQLTVTGSAGSNYVVQVATNLSAPTTWSSLFTNASPFTFVDSNAQNFPQRFYRAQAR